MRFGFSFTVANALRFRAISSFGPNRGRIKSICKAVAHHPSHLTGQSAAAYSRIGAIRALRHRKRHRGATEAVSEGDQAEVTFRKRKPPSLREMTP